MSVRCKFPLLLLSLFFVVGFELFAAPLAISNKVQGLMENYCFDCHDGDSKKGDIQLDNLKDLTLQNRLDLLNKVQEQIYIKEMPPRKKKVQPNEIERQQLLDWLSIELGNYNASTLEEKLRYSNYGNYVDHEKLFNGEVKEKSFSPARRWLINPRIFNERVMDVFHLDRNERTRFTQRQDGVLSGVKNPFIIPDRSGVRDYDVRMLNGGHLLVMITNAKWIAQRQIFSSLLKTLQNQNSVDDLNSTRTAGTPANSISGRDQWYPKVTPDAFEKIVLKKEFPTEVEMRAAVQEQFNSVLRRKATEEELTKYVELLRSSISLAGNSEGLQQMLFAVLLESDFLYRLEFGGGEIDDYGRRKLTPQEASFAISYALGDLSPDPELLKAAKEGRLETREDYRREVKRLLSDEKYYKGPVDPSLTSRHMRSHETSHPKIVRFFREFFGYPLAAKIFKDTERSDGYYKNPDRGTLGTPGFLINEADRLVDWYIKKDKNVFENLLTTEKFFVYHNKDNETGRKIIAEWSEFYKRLKDTDWKNNPEGVLAEHMEFIKTKPSLKRLVPGSNDKFQRRTFLRFMHFFSDTIGKGRTPFTTLATTHGYAYHHSTFYSLPPTPTLPRYANVESKNFKGNLPDADFWDYPVVQPFKISNRKGLLTHPAWLIAHSSNFHTDPIKRGRWIREKLLAGQVPDVPITVDAQVPEDPHKTLRERVELVTRKAECSKCHVRMNPLGFPFESFDDFGRYRLNEPLEHEEHFVAKPNKVPARPWNIKGFPVYKTKKVSTKGELRGTGNPNLDGEVSDAFDLIDRLAKSERVRQSIIRHAFRFYMGRNELLSDSQTLIDADHSYVQSGGSFKAVIISLLTSDSFIYRK